MRVHILGSAGGNVTPRPLCTCRICREARQKGPPYSRWGPALFVEGPDILFDTPEEISLELARADIRRVGAVIYSHWHPDHSLGMRVFEQMNVNWRAARSNRAMRTTPVYLPERVRRNFEACGLMRFLSYYESMGLARLHILGDESTVEIGSVEVRVFPLAAPALCGYELSERGKRLVLAIDDTKSWMPGPELAGADLAVIECGWFEFDTGGNRIMHPDAAAREQEAPVEETLEKVRALGAKRAILTHIENAGARSYDDYLALENEHKKLRITFAYDGLVTGV